MSVQMQQVKQIHIKLDSALHQKLKVLAAIDGVTIQELVASMIQEKVRNFHLDELPHKEIS